MTGDQVVTGFWIFIIAVCLPAIVGALARKYVAKPRPAAGRIQSFLLPVLIYAGGFFFAWGFFIFLGWRGSQQIDRLLLDPLPYALASSIYGATIGAFIFLFSAGMPREVRRPEHHLNVMFFGVVAVAALKIVSVFSMNDYLRRSAGPDDSVLQSDSGSFPDRDFQYNHPLGKTESELNRQYDLMLDQLERKCSKCNPSSSSFDRRFVESIAAKASVHESYGASAPMALKLAAEEIAGVVLFVPPSTSD